MSKLMARLLALLLPARLTPPSDPEERAAAWRRVERVNRRALEINASVQRWDAEVRREQREPD